MATIGGDADNLLPGETLPVADSTIWSGGSIFGEVSDFFGKGVDLATDVLGGVFDFKARKLELDYGKAQLESQYRAQTQNDPVRTRLFGDFSSQDFQSWGLVIGVIGLGLTAYALFFRK